MRKIIFLSLLCVATLAWPAPRTAEPEWASLAYRTVRYPSSDYFTGYATHRRRLESKAEALRKAEEAARVEAAAMIRVKIANETNYISAESSLSRLNNLSSLYSADEQFSSKTTSSVELDLTGMQVVSAMDGRTAYAFAYIAKEDLRRQLKRSIEASLTTAEADVDHIDALIQTSQTAVAKKSLKALMLRGRQIRQDQQLLIAIDTCTSLDAVQLVRSNTLRQRIVNLLPAWSLILNPISSNPYLTPIGPSTTQQPSPSTSLSSTPSFLHSGTTLAATDNARALSTLVEAIKDWKQCKTGTLTEVGKGVAIYANNGWKSVGMTSSIEKKLNDKLHEVNDAKYVILDVTMTANDRWCVLYSKSDSVTAASWYNAPNGAGDKMKELFAEGDLFRSVSFTDKDYVLITDKHYTASNDWDLERLNTAYDLYGPILSVCTTEKGIVVCCEKGVYYDHIPEKVKSKIQDFISSYGAIQFVKFTDSGTCLITNGHDYSYYM